MFLNIKSSFAASGMVAGGVEVAALVLLLAGGAGGENLLAGVGVDAGVVYFGGKGHGRWGEVLDLLETEVEGTGLGGKPGHVGLGASGVGRDEVGDELLI